MADAFQPKFVDLVRNYTTTIGTGRFRARSGGQRLRELHRSRARPATDSIIRRSASTKPASARSAAARCSPAA